MHLRLMTAQIILFIAKLEEASMMNDIWDSIGIAVIAHHSDMIRKEDKIPRLPGIPI